MNLDLIKQEFDNYVKTFDMNDKDINYKYRHSYRVYELCEQLSKKLGLSNEEIVLASVIGLLHDIGRFEQLKHFSSYKDINLDHGEFGAVLLFKEGLIKKFSIDSKYHEIIKFAIRNHNKYEIEDTNDDNMIKFAKIVRDADKLDILRAYTIYNDYNLKEDGNQISSNVAKTFYNHRQILYTDLNNKNDFIILSLAMIFDLNLKTSFEILKKDKIIEEFYKNKTKKIFKDYFDDVVKYLDMQCTS